MLGLDDHLAQLAGGQGLLVALAVAVLLGLRHATDPDHLTAVSTLVLSEAADGTRRAVRLGLAWGAGHATTLLLAGLPVVLLGRSLPAAVQQVAEIVIGLVIVALGARLLWRWHAGYLHVHAHEHRGVWHAHPHVHERVHARAPHAGHAHPDDLGRSPRAAYGIGLVHGIGGSAGVGILLISAIPSRGEAVLALVLFAGATALSMSVLSGVFGAALTRGAATRRLERLTPAFGALALLFGAWYALGAAGALPSAF